VKLSVEAYPYTLGFFLDQRDQTIAYCEGIVIVTLHRWAIAALIVSDRQVRLPIARE
jgi:hypothetical protein